MEFHISRKARDRYRFDASLITIRGNVIFPDLRAVRRFAQQMNAKREADRFPERTVQPGDLYAMGLIDEILHHVVALYREEKKPLVMEEALQWLHKNLGRGEVEKALRKFSEEFPSISLYRGEIDLDTYLEGKTEGIENRQVALEEMLLLWLANVNPAFSPFLELFDDTVLAEETAYASIIEQLSDFFRSQPTFGPEDQSLLEMLRSPARAVPHSLWGQLEYILKRWGYLLGRYLPLLLRGLDLLKEEEIARMRRFSPLSHPPPAEVYQYTGQEEEPERFSPDLEWMPKVVLLAKNIYVWLHQLSRKYRRSINRLDQIPDEELDLLARWGITGLWLIGIWERSLASKKIKELMGNPEAAASAYSLFDYEIAGDLGGEEAFQNLKDRAGRRGIRLASDMVPNHMGIDSRWVIHHPDWFIQSEESPFPSYRFNGPDLSWHGEIGIYLEDHYYDRTDAAVVFKWVDRRTGQERYMYHGNDGTRMPWNDTAQLNFLKAEVREAVIQTILHVARKFPIIRFDAAMTLTKKHYQRLWFPEPGTGGAIPSRAEHGMSREEFNRHMPEEFWRQVVDRVGEEAPETLLLAEAFWLLEGYFVRSLGMHRVYNSAFMNMLKDEENANYRSVMKNTLEFNPEILKRFVNFMSNPDEETAIAQFGREDKYFGICTLMVTLPGLPMFAHGQIEGFREKYGMEYRTAKWDEEPDLELIDRHEREIFPLLKRRPLFAEVRHFLLYDFFTPEGWVNEDVFAYSNRLGEERALVLYHNRYGHTSGWVRTSVAYSTEAGGERILIQKTLGEGLGLQGDPHHFCLFRDHISGLQYIRNSKELCEKGLYAELGAYEYHVFLDFREVQDNLWGHYEQLNRWLGGRGVADLEAPLREIRFSSVRQAFRAFVSAPFFQRLMEARLTRSGTSVDRSLLDEVEQRLRHFLRAVDEALEGPPSGEALSQEIRQKLEAILYLPVLTRRPQLFRPKGLKALAEYLHQNLQGSPDPYPTLLSWLFVHFAKRAMDRKEGPKGLGPDPEQGWIDEAVVDTLRGLGVEEEIASRSVRLIHLLIRHGGWFEEEDLLRVVEDLFEDPEASQFLGVNLYQDLLWFHQESFEELLWWWMLIAALQIGYHPLRPAKEVIRGLERSWSMIQRLQEAERRSQYQVGRLKSILRTENP
ncbi:MAG: alpha-amylase family glycosyl hydrolase [Desulfobacterota bacterium]|nr:alpha-amylase family glycosyl hydrolase [Thermodesulfobacteriota bacterium]